MAARKKPRGERPADRTRAMNAFLAQLKHPLRAEIAAIRTIIMQASDQISERVKWDAPVFYYRQDFATFDLHLTKNVHLILLFPAETVVPDADGLIGLDHEGRREITFHNMTQVAARRTALTQLVRDFIIAMKSDVQ